VDMYERIALARKRAGFSKSELARALGVTPTACNSWELPSAHKNSSRPSVANLAKLAAVLNVRFEWLATGRGEVQSPPMERSRLPAGAQGRSANRQPPDKPRGLDAEQRRLLDVYRNLPPGERKVLLGFVKMAAQSYRGEKEVK
jgi:transcriptional regulator with XRE-family HTH domain